MRQTIGGRIDLHALAVLAQAAGLDMSKAKATRHKAKDKAREPSPASTGGRGPLDPRGIITGPTAVGFLTCTNPKILSIKDLTP